MTLREESFSFFSGAGSDIVVFTSRLLNVVINLLSCHKIRHLLLVRCSAHVANAIGGDPCFDVHVVALHLGERLLENQGPNNIAVAQLGPKRLSINEWDVVVDDNGLRHAENEEIDGVATWLEQTPLKHGFHVVAGCCDSCGSCEEPAVANLALFDVGSFDCFIAEFSLFDHFRDATIL